MGRRVFLHRCASPASHIACPCTLLTSCCVRAWQDRSRDIFKASPPSWALYSPTLRAARAGVRLTGVCGRREERGRRECAMAVTHVKLYPYMHACTGTRVYCGPRP